ncbi:hypothetical protein D6C86_09942 [Aureobasidium pullulans]|uniref:Uncharacterized protein n=1 Tax=Aureobasidium pullulans TaxID=5580 RepID=A0A4V4KNV0_AURPU|nr:hypothetical protein D6C94_10531 [Aureobasidium pullulans]THZ35841.1 hypothetical protein D6C87_09553 [Aureobasidium pullulans]THZ53215.1 hypothetical protein D6C86_09942 [Aureobasidium pullulans]THZ53436.1 hypothetical protein D6C88_09619 [Aureobasidium pullulans]
MFGRTDTRNSGFDATSSSPFSTSPGKPSEKPSGKPSGFLARRSGRVLKQTPRQTGRESNTALLTHKPSSGCSGRTLGKKRPGASSSEHGVRTSCGVGRWKEQPKRRARLLYETALLTPKSIEKASKSIKTRNKHKLRISTTRKIAETYNFKAEQDTGGTRQRRRIDYDAVPAAWHDKDNSDSDYECETTTMIRQSLQSPTAREEEEEQEEQEEEEEDDDDDGSVKVKKECLGDDFKEA